MSVETTTSQDKQITVDVPEDRVAEFYAFYGRFLAGFPGRRRGRGPGHRHGPGGHHHGCHHRDEEQPAEAASPGEQTGPETTIV